MNNLMNQNNNDELIGCFNNFAKLIKKQMDKCLPVRVTRVSKDRAKVNVKPLINIVSEDKKTIERNEIKGIPVHTLGDGDFLISFKIKVGTLGWIESSDRDISLFKQSLTESGLNTYRMHSFSDARFIPDIMKNFTIAKEDEDALVIQTKSGNIKIALDNSTIRMTSPNDVIINGGRVTPKGDFITKNGVSLDNHPHKQGVDSGGNTEKDTEKPTATE